VRGFSCENANCEKVRTRRKKTKVLFILLKDARVRTFVVVTKQKREAHKDLPALSKITNEDEN
jgi:aspartyl/asparaginyl-tRNA synthetase